jgi:hypothetical protein
MDVAHLMAYDGEDKVDGAVDGEGARVCKAAGVAAAMAAAVQAFSAETRIVNWLSSGLYRVACDADAALELARCGALPAIEVFSACADASGCSQLCQTRAKEAVRYVRAAAARGDAAEAGLGK